MSAIRLKVLRAFPVWRRKDETKIGEIIGLERVDFSNWKLVGGAFFMVGFPKDHPDFSGARLYFLKKEGYICDPDEDELHE